MYLFGGAIVDKEESIPYKFLAGYCGYSFLVACGGIPVQVLNLSWSVFYIYMIFILVVTTSFVVWKYINYPELYQQEKFLVFIREHWLIIMCSGILLIFSFAYVSILWSNNLTDDGFYLSKIASYPYSSQPFRSNPSTGLSQVMNGANAYIINVGELEASFYVYITRMSASVYARFFMSGFNYLLFTSCIYALAFKIFTILKMESYREIIQYTVSIVIFFGFSSTYLMQHSILILQDSWQLNTAMYYGSSIVRTMGILFLIVPFLERKELYLKDVLMAGIISVVLLSKSTIALPVIYITCVAYLIVSLLFSEHKNRKYYAIGILIMLAIISSFLPNTNEFREMMWASFITTISSYVFITSFVIFIASFSLNDTRIIKINCIFIVMIILMFFSPINSIFEQLSIYGFVGLRAQTTLMYSFMATNYIYLFVIFSKYFKDKKHVKVVGIVISVTFLVGNVQSIREDNSVINNYSIIRNNLELIPQSTVELGKSLERLYTKKQEEINVIMPEAVSDNGYVHFVPIIIRAVAPNVNSITAITRFDVTEGNDFSNFSSSEQKKYDEIILDLNDDSFNQFNDMLNEFPINCVILINNDAQDYLEEINFELYDIIEVENSGVIYYVFHRPSEGKQG
jgi:hypothetical protein